MVHRLDTSVGVSGPHGFAVRNRLQSSRKPPTSTASLPPFETFANALHLGTGWAQYRNDLFGKQEIYFLRKDLTRLPIIGTGRFARRVEIATRRPCERRDPYRVVLSHRQGHQYRPRANSAAAYGSLLSQGRQRSVTSKPPSLRPTKAASPCHRDAGEQCG